MKKKILKTISLLICLSLLMANVAFAKEELKNTSIDAKKEILINKGYPQQTLNIYGESLINYLFDKLQKDNIEKIAVSTEEYICDFPSNVRATIPTSTLKVMVNTYNYADATGRITGLDIDTNYTWIVEPTVRFTDAITLNWDPTMFKYSGYMNGHNTVINSQDNQTDFFNFMSVAASENSAGIGWNTELKSPNISADLQNQPYGQFYISFDVAKEFYAQDDVRTIINYQYNHSTGLPLSFVKNGNNVSISSSGTVDVLSRRIVYSSKVIDM